MHIQEGTITTLTTCTKMTEEVDRRHGVNGNSSSKGASDEHVAQHSASTAHSGGSLKFFKDGKFILELVRGCAREGERSGWVSVPRKTFWPPAAPAPHPHTPRQERAASLSVSDDNSSIQSSPWQRDHCWKQSTPRRNISKELTFYYCRPSTLHSSAIEAGSRRKRRRPHSPAADDRRTNGLDRRNGHAHSPPAPAPSAEREKYYHMKLKKPHQYHKLRAYKKTKPSIMRKKLNGTIERLREKVAALPAPVNAKLAHCRQQEHAMVSPRKRILREMERVSLQQEDAGGKRRARPPAPGPSARPPAAPPTPPTPPTPPASKNVSSYSIHSLLSLDAPPAPPPPPRLPPPPPPLWLHYAPPHWPPPLAHHPYMHHHLLHNDDSANEMPLNLSKH